MKDLKEPPIGIVPQNIFYEKRIQELKRAICAYAVNGLMVPVEWIIEYNRITAWLNEM